MNANIRSLADGRSFRPVSALFLPLTIGARRPSWKGDGDLLLLRKWSNPN